MKNNGTKSSIIRKEFRGTVRANWSKREANMIIAEAVKNGFDEDYCFDIYAQATRPM